MPRYIRFTAKSAVSALQGKNGGAAPGRGKMGVKESLAILNKLKVLGALKCVSKENISHIKNNEELFVLELSKIEELSSPAFNARAKKEEEEVSNAIETINADDKNFDFLSLKSQMQESINLKFLTKHISSSMKVCVLFECT